MAAIRVVQVAVDKVIDVIAMRDRGMSASRAVFVSAIVGATIVFWSAARGILAANLQSVLVHVIAVLVVEMRIVEIIGVSVVVHCHMTASAAVGVWMICMDFMFSFHSLPLACCGASQRPLCLVLAYPVDGLFQAAIGLIRVPFRGSYCKVRETTRHATGGIYSG